MVRNLSKVHGIRIKTGFRHILDISDAVLYTLKHVKLQPVLIMSHCKRYKTKGQRTMVMKSYNPGTSMPHHRCAT